MIDSQKVTSIERVIDHVLDTSGLTCPEPLMLLHSKVRDMRDGDVVEIIATDPSTQRDIPKFCAFLFHQLISYEERGKKFYYYIRKGGGGPD